MDKELKRLEVRLWGVGVGKYLVVDLYLPSSLWWPFWFPFERPAR